MFIQHLAFLNLQYSPISRQFGKLATFSRHREKNLAACSSSFLVFLCRSSLGHYFATLYECSLEYVNSLSFLLVLYSFSLFILLHPQLLFLYLFVSPPPPLPPPSRTLLFRFSMCLLLSEVYQVYQLCLLVLGYRQYLV